MTLFAELVRELDSPHCAKTPTPTFRAVLAALDQLDTASTTQIAYTSGVRRSGAHVILFRLRRYGCATLDHGDLMPNGLHRATRWTITPLGRMLAHDLQGVVA